MRIAVGADHRGADALEHVVNRLRDKGHEVEAITCDPDQSCDYPDSAWNIGSMVANGAAERGILLCGSGIGMSIAANKIKGVRAALVHDELTAEMSRSHNDANVLCLSADLLGLRLIDKIVDLWTATEFEGGRHGRRVHKIEVIERGEDPASVTG